MRGSPWLGGVWFFMTMSSAERVRPSGGWPTLSQEDISADIKYMVRQSYGADGGLDGASPSRHRKNTVGRE